ncbi:ATP-dependent nuclease [Methylobacterium sp. J-067]|uniref:ATP-dependent nuclease n=1 Tax=Methylobacterium sp. J-067 TaxID=2836648 RepID=UPI001FBBFD36|nr:AAA family ATPase [Methylobacterium sp. J-067]MCJ2024461.1 AAA family ATPase [Methylobacterium sp. J-067]
MHISRLVIKNFRCIRDLDISLSPTSVIIGENNAGKSAVLDAVKIALGRKWGRSGQTGFSEYDFPYQRDAGVPRPEILIKLWLAEAQPAEWPQPLIDELFSIVRTDPHTGLNSICMQVVCTFESVAKSVEPVWQFINDQDVPLAGAGA